MVHTVYARYEPESQGLWLVTYSRIAYNYMLAWREYESQMKEIRFAFQMREEVCVDGVMDRERVVAEWMKEYGAEE